MLAEANQDSKQVLSLALVQQVPAELYRHRQKYRLEAWVLALLVE
jgi:hypothetical protein